MMDLPSLEKFNRELLEALKRHFVSFWNLLAPSFLYLFSLHCLDFLPPALNYLCATLITAGYGFSVYSHKRMKAVTIVSVMAASVIVSKIGFLFFCLSDVLSIVMNNSDHVRFGSLVGILLFVKYASILAIGKSRCHEC